MARIVLAEDDASLARIFSRWLSADGHEVTIAENGLAGFRSATFSEHPDLLVTDLMMPETDGESLAAMFDMILPGRPILVVTAVADEGVLQRVAETPAVHAVVRKPVKRDDLCAAVTAALAAGEA
jgi:CheY-like chemotaxis protein